MLKTIKSRREFEKVFRCGERANHRLVRMTAVREDEGGCGKVAFVAPKRLGNAVFRNRCKRILREAARAAGLPRDGYQVILFATHMTPYTHPDEVGKAITGLMKRITTSKRRDVRS